MAFRVTPERGRGTCARRTPGGNIFAELVVTFASRGTVTLTTFGPPSAAHAYVITPTDDTLQGGSTDIYRLEQLQRGNEPLFNLGNTCAPEGEPTTTTTT